MPAIKTELNLNTVVMVLGFLATFGGLVASWSNLKQEQESFAEFVREQKGINARLEERNNTQDRSLAELPNITYRVGQVEAAGQAMDDRVTRTSESYAGQFADIRSTLSTIQTSMALVQNSLDRIEAWRDSERGPRRMMMHQEPGSATP